MTVNKKVSIAVVKRLPRYFRYLSDLIKQDVRRISSAELSKKMGVTASQIRQDLNCFGGFGQQGYGYNVPSLYDEVSNILGVKRGFNTIIIGAGNMGRALANYGNFINRGFKHIGIFDVSPELIGENINGLEVMDMKDMDDFIKNNQVDIAILSIPYSETAKTAERIAKLGVKGLWNFSPMDLKLPYDIIIENVHLSDYLMVLGYKVLEKENNEAERI